MRSRFIIPDFFSDEKVADLAPLERLLFQGLWCMADRNGVLRDSPRQIKAKILPYDDCNIAEMLCRLSDKGFIYRYRHSERPYIWIPNFQKHQKIHWKENESGLPMPNDSEISSIGQGWTMDASYLTSDPDPDPDPDTTKKRIPFTVDELLRTLSQSSKGRVAIKPFDRGLAPRITEVIREMQAQGLTLKDARQAGEWIAAGGITFRLDASWVATTGKLIGTIAKAKAESPAPTRVLTAKDYER